MKKQSVLRDRSFAQRNPKLFIAVFSTVALSIFFSKPIYDFFIAPPPLDIEELRKSGRKSPLFK